jgi:amino acid transporter, AAT family
MNPKQESKKLLLPRHVQMMALGGMIGAGMFKGSSESLSIAGPSVAISYLIGGIILLIVMGALAELTSVYPKSDIKSLIHKAFGYRASFIIGWLYWVNWVLVMAVEIVAAGNFLQFWFAKAPLWMLSTLVAIGIIFINMIHVRFYGELEYWLAGVKITTLILFILVGGAILFGITPGQAHPLFFSNFTQHGGFFPHGWSGIFSALLIVMFSYGGAELIGITVNEMEDAKRVLPKVVKSVVGRVIIFYALPILIIAGLVPWNEVNPSVSPFVQVFSATGLRGAADVMNFVMLTAVVSAANSGMYATSRMLFSMAQSGEAPGFFRQVSKNGVPYRAVIVSALSLFIGVIAAYIAPAQVFRQLMSIPGFSVLIVWISICLAQFKLRRHYPSKPNFKLAYFPYATIASILSLVSILVIITVDPNNLLGSLICFSVLVLLFILSKVKNDSKLLAEDRKAS